jgi:hypothetical protein
MVVTIRSLFDGRLYKLCFDFAVVFLHIFLNQMAALVFSKFSLLFLEL